jgi:hypothetical protein
MRTARTTLVLDAQLLKRAKTLAAQTGTTVSAIVNQALTEAFSQPSVERPPRFEMVVFGAGPVKYRHAPEDFALVAEEEDRDAYRRGS